MSIPPAGQNPLIPQNAQGIPEPPNSDQPTPQNPQGIPATPSSSSSETPHSSPQDVITTNSNAANLFKAKLNIKKQKQGINFGKYVTEAMLRKDFEIFGSDPGLAPGFIAALNEPYDPSDLIQKIVSIFSSLPKDIVQITDDHYQGIEEKIEIERIIEDKTSALFMGRISNLFDFDYNPISPSFYAYDKERDWLKIDSEGEFNDHNQDQIKEGILQASKNFPRIISFIPALANKLSDYELKVFENYLERVIESIIDLTNTGDNEPANVLAFLPLLFRLEAGIKTDETLEDDTKQKIQEVLKKSIIQIINSLYIDKKKLLGSLEKFATQDNASDARTLVSFILGQEGQKAINEFKNGSELFNLIYYHISTLKSHGHLSSIIPIEVEEKQEALRQIHLVKSLINPKTNESRRNAWIDPIDEISKGLEGKKGIILTPRYTGIFQSVSDSSLSQLSTSDNLKPTKTMEFLEKLLQSCAFEDLYINGGIIPADLIKELMDINLPEAHFYSEDQEEKIESRFIASIQEFFKNGDFTDLNTYLKRQGVDFTNPSPSIVRFLNFMNTLKTLSLEQDFKITFSRSFDKTKLLNPPNKSIFLGRKDFGLSEDEAWLVDEELYKNNSPIDRISLFSKPPRKNNFSRIELAEPLVAKCQFELAKEINEPAGPFGAVATRIDQQFKQKYDPSDSLPSNITKSYPNFVVSITEDDDTEEDEVDIPQYSLELDPEENLLKA